MMDIEQRAEAAKDACGLLLRSLFSSRVSAGLLLWGRFCMPHNDGSPESFSPLFVDTSEHGIAWVAFVERDSAMFW